MKKIPITLAKDISNKYEYDMVIIIGKNKDGNGHITTYGKTKELCKEVGKIGQQDIADMLFKR